MLRLDFTWDILDVTKRFGKVCTVLSSGRPLTNLEEKCEDSVLACKFDILHKTQDIPVHICARAIPKLCHGVHTVMLEVTKGDIESSLSLPAVAFGIISGETSAIFLGDSLHSWGLDCFGNFIHNQTYARFPLCAFHIPRRIFLRLNLEVGTLEASCDARDWQMLSKKIPLEKQYFFACSMSSVVSVEIRRLLSVESFRSIALRLLPIQFKVPSEPFFSCLSISENSVFKHIQDGTYRIVLCDHLFLRWSIGNSANRLITCKDFKFSY